MKKTLKKALERQQEILSAAQSENRELTADEQREFDMWQDVIDDLRDSQNNGGDNQRSEKSGGNNDPAPAPENNNAGQRQQPEEHGFTADDVVTIGNICRHFDIDMAEVRGMTVAQVQAEAVRRQMEDNPPIASRIQVTSDEYDNVKRAIADGLLLRSGGTVEKPAEGANSFRGARLRDIAVECLEREHHGTDYRHMSDNNLLAAISRDFMNPEALFPAIMDDVLQKSYNEGLTKANVTFDKWVKFGALSNFKKTQNHEYLMSLSGELEKLPENGELKAYMPKDVRMPERQLGTYGKKFTLTRQAIIDDDIGMITTLPRRFAAATMTTQNKAVYDVLLGSKPIFDGKVMYSKERKNLLTTGTMPTFGALQKMIYMIGIQKDAAGNQLALIPDLIIVPFGMGIEVQKLLMSPTINTAENTQAYNPYYNNKFTVVEDVYLNGFVKEGAPCPWFMGVKEHMIQLDTLNGKRDATIIRADRPDGLGVSWNVIFDFGVSVIFPEASVKNPGVPITIDD